MADPHPAVRPAHRPDRPDRAGVRHLLHHDGRRSRLVVLNAADNLIENRNPALLLADAMPPPGATPLYDVFSFHGGGGSLPTQWGGPHGRGRPAVCSSTRPPTAEQIVNGADERVGTKTVHHRGILDAIRRFSERPVAFIFDTDAQYWAQKNVTPYVEEVLRVDGSYDYRWAARTLPI